MKRFHTWRRIHGGFASAEGRFRIVWVKQRPAGFYTIHDRLEFIGTRVILRNAQALCDRIAWQEFETRQKAQEVSL